MLQNSFLLPFYLEHFPDWTQTRASTVTAAFGLMNLVTRPAGGLVADMLYRWAGERRGLDAKKYWICFLVIVQGAFLVWIGLVNSSSPALLIGSLAGAGIFMQAANGATYALLPHVNPHVNGLMGGTVGSSGNLGEFPSFPRVSLPSSSLTLVIRSSPLRWRCIQHRRTLLFLRTNNLDRRRNRYRRRSCSSFHQPSTKASACCCRSPVNDYSCIPGPHASRVTFVDTFINDHHFVPLETPSCSG